MRRGSVEREDPKEDRDAGEKSATRVREEGGGGEKVDMGPLTYITKQSP